MPLETLVYIFIFSIGLNLIGSEKYNELKSLAVMYLFLFKVFPLGILMFLVYRVGERDIYK